MFRFRIFGLLGAVTAIAVIFSLYVGFVIRPERIRVEVERCGHSVQIYDRTPNVAIPEPEAFRAFDAFRNLSVTLRITQGLSAGPPCDIAACLDRFNQLPGEKVIEIQTLEVMPAAVLPSLSKVDRLIGLRILECRNFGSDFNWSNGFRDLEGLTIHPIDVDHWHLPGICDLPRLKALRLVGAAIDDELVMELRHSHLETLEIEQSYSATGKALTTCGNIRSLKRLTLNSTETTDESLEPMAGESNLEYLDLSGCIRLGDGIQALIQQMPHLQYLNLGYTSITDALVDSLLRHQSLRELDVHGCKLSETSIQTLQNRFQLHWKTLF